MDILILGGTRFVGRHLVDAALARGHTLTLFNRGQSNPGLFEGVEEIRGDRMTDLHRLGDRRFDCVIDTCGYVPRAVDIACGVLGDKVGRYAFISTVSVYDIDKEGPFDESHPLMPAPDPETEEVTPETYGGLKALCEVSLLKHLGERALILRPGLIVGPYDTTDRFTYWPWRVFKGGEVLAPGPQGREVRFLDGRDLADFTLLCLESERGGAFTLVGPTEGCTFGSLLAQCEAEARERGAGGGQVTWVEEPFLLEKEVIPYVELPLWVPSSLEGFNRFHAEKAEAAGFETRPFQETIADTLDWLAATGHRVSKAGLKGEREEGLLEAWADSTQGG